MRPHRAVARAAVMVQPYRRIRHSQVNQKLTGAWLQERVQVLVRKVCGIGLSNEWTPPAMFTACMAITACKSKTRSLGPLSTSYTPGTCLEEEAGPLVHDCYELRIDLPSGSKMR